MTEGEQGVLSEELPTTSLANLDSSTSGQAVWVFSQMWFELSSLRESVNRDAVSVFKSFGISRALVGVASSFLKRVRDGKVAG
jgi:hypothetical protein